LRNKFIIYLLIVLCSCLEKKKNSSKIDFFKITEKGIENSTIKIGERYSLLKSTHKNLQYKYDNILFLDYIEIPIKDNDTLTYYLGVENDTIISILFFDKRINFNGIFPKDPISKLSLYYPNLKIKYDNDLNMEFLESKDKKIGFYVSNTNEELIGKYKNDELLESLDYNKVGYIDFIVITPKKKL
jgi:hypothetical protein